MDKSFSVDIMAEPPLADQLNAGQARTLPHQAVAKLREGDSLRSILQQVREEAERNAIAQALEMTGWNRKAAARLLKVSYRSMLYKIEQYRMSSPDRFATTASNSIEADTPRASDENFG